MESMNLFMFLLRAMLRIYIYIYAYKYLVTVCPCGRTTTTSTELHSMGQPVCPSYQEGHVGCLPGDELVRPGQCPPGDHRGAIFSTSNSSCGALSVE